jgi:beta-lactamase class C
MGSRMPSIVSSVLCAFALLPSNGRAAGDETGNVETIVARAIQPVMERYGVPGMAVGVAFKDQGYVFNFGVASRTTGTPVTDNTLFEIGSVSKTFTATLAAYAQASGKLLLSDMASKYLQDLHGSSFDRVSLLDLGTHTSGGLPLQVPSNITNDAQLMAYLQGWKPTYAPGTFRTYSNPSIGMLGMIAAKSMNDDFVALMEGKMFPWLGMKHTYLDVPMAQMDNYAQGYTASGMPIRLAPGVLAPETYGVRTTAGDLLRFVEANMGMLNLDETLLHAISSTHTGYFRIGAMTQDLIWEQYSFPVGLAELLSGNSAKIALEPNSATRLVPPLSPQEAVLINKTGSTNGFVAYVAFVPEKRIGIVLLANRNYPTEPRVTAAYEILTRLIDDAPKR